MPALDRALALDERHDRAVLVAEQLDLDVARRRDAALEVDGGIAERGAGFGARGPHRVEERVGGRRPSRMPLPPPPATALTISG